MIQHTRFIPTHAYGFDALSARFAQYPDGALAMLQQRMIKAGRQLAGDLAKPYALAYPSDWQPCADCRETLTLAHKQHLLDRRPTTAAILALFETERVAAAMRLRQVGTRVMARSADGTVSPSAHLARQVATYHRALTIWQLGEQCLDLHDAAQVYARNATYLEAILTLNTLED